MRFYLDFRVMRTKTISSNDINLDISRFRFHTGSNKTADKQAFKSLYMWFRFHTDKTKTIARTLAELEANSFRFHNG